MYLEIATPVVNPVVIVFVVLVSLWRITNYVVTRNAKTRQLSLSDDFLSIVSMHGKIIPGAVFFLMLWFSVDPISFGGNIYRFTQIITTILVLDYLQFFFFWILRKLKQSVRGFRIKNK